MTDTQLKPFRVWVSAHSSFIGKFYDKDEAIKAAWDAFEGDNPATWHYDWQGKTFQEFATGVRVEQFRNVREMKGAR